MTALVIGATGKTGRRVVEALRARDFDVRAAGQAGVIYLVGPGKLARPGLLVEAFLARLPGVSRVVALSDIEAATVDDDTWPNREIERAVQRSGKEWTVLRSNWFHQNFTEVPLFTAAMHARGEIVAPVGEGRVSFIDAADVAEAAAVTMTTDGHDGQAYLLTGPQALTFGQVAAALTKAGRSVRHVDVAPGDMTASLTAMGLPAPVVELFRFLFRQIRDDRNSEVTDTVEKLTGRPARSLAAFLAASLKEDA